MTEKKNMEKEYQETKYAKQTRKKEESKDLRKNIE